MPRSMTGYAKVQGIFDEYRISCEVKTLNSKGLAIDVSVPYFLSSKELDVISAVKRYVNRGKVTVRVLVKFLKPVQAIYDFSIVRTYFDMLSELRENLGLPSPVDIAHLLSFKDAFQFEFSSEEIEEAWNLTSRVLDEALRKVVEERSKEGEKLTSDLRLIVSRLSELHGALNERAHELPKLVAERIRKNASELLPDDVELDKNLFESAVALISDRSDIREELVRLDSHIKRVQSLLDSDEPVGDLLNFLTQEMLRELNTILSKSRSLEITNIALDGKFLVSQLREQIANIE